MLESLKRKAIQNFAQLIFSRAFRIEFPSLSCCKGQFSIFFKHFRLGLTRKDKIHNLKIRLRTIFRSSSMAEHSAVNRRVVSSSLTCGANFYNSLAAVLGLAAFLFPVIFPFIPFILMFYNNFLHVWLNSLCFNSAQVSFYKRGDYEKH